MRPAAPLASHRRGFTLVELLITMAIIAILVSLSLGAIFVAQETARAERSRMVVQKLHNVVIDRWESYRTRRMNLAAPVVNPPAWNRLNAIRELMRMEMPDRYEDLTFAPRFNASIPALRSTYLRRVGDGARRYNVANSTSLTTSQYISTVLSNGTTPNLHESAECLYLYIMSSCSGDERAEFTDKEVADTNGNFMPEFIDGWGTPIHFLRWAPGFVSDVHVLEPEIHHDPFDPYATQMGLQSANINKRAPPLGPSEPAPFAAGSNQVWGFAMLPLIFSPGPDRAYGIQEFVSPAQIPWPSPMNNISYRNEDPYARYDDSGTFRSRGEGFLVNGETVHFDNIHNHNPTR